MSGLSAAFPEIETQTRDVVAATQRTALDRRLRRLARAAAGGTKPALRRRMNQLITNVVGWLASLLFIATATVLWGVAAGLVWISGNGTATGGAGRFAK